MTTIATDGKSMAGDCQTTGGGFICRMAPKVHRAPDGRLFGACGDVTDCLKFARYMLTNGDRPELGENFCALILNLDGSVHWIDRNWEPVEHLVPFAVGTGDMMAIGAMLAGATPRRAVAIAASRDVNSGGPVTSKTLKSARRA